MGKIDIQGYSDVGMRKAGKKDGRLWRWSIKPWFIVSKDPLPEPGKPARKINELAEAAEEMLAGVLGEWHQVDGLRKKLAQRAVERIRSLDPTNPEMSGHVTKSRSEYSDACIDRRTAWNVARARVNGIQQRYSELGQAYVHANHAARRDMKVQIPVPDLDVPMQLQPDAFVPLEKALGLTTEEIAQLRLMPDNEEAAPVAAAS